MTSKPSWRMLAISVKTLHFFQSPSPQHRGHLSNVVTGAARLQGMGLHRQGQDVWIKLYFPHFSGVAHLLLPFKTFENQVPLVLSIRFKYLQWPHGSHQPCHSTCLLPAAPRSLLSARPLWLPLSNGLLILSPASPPSVAAGSQVSVSTQLSSGGCLIFSLTHVLSI